MSLISYCIRSLARPCVIKRRRFKCILHRPLSTTIDTPPTASPPSPPVSPQTAKEQSYARIRRDVQNLAITQLVAMHNNKKPPQLQTDELVAYPDATQRLIPREALSSSLTGVDVTGTERSLDELISAADIQLVTVSYNAHALDTSDQWCNAFKEYAEIVKTKSTITSASSLTSQPPSQEVIQLSRHNDHNTPTYNTIEFNIVKSIFLRYFQSSIISNQQKIIVPENRHQHIINIFNTQTINNIFETQNKYLKIISSTMLGSICLLDWNGIIRWRAYGNMTDNDRLLMENAIQTLTDEYLARNKRMSTKASTLSSHNVVKQVKSDVQQNK